MIPWVGRTLRGFHHRVSCRLAGMQPQLDLVGWWEYPSLEAAMAAAGLEEVETYILSCQNTISQYIATRLIMELCLEAERRPVAQVAQIW